MIISAMPSLGCKRPWRKYLLSALAAVLFVALVGAADGAVKEPAYRPDTCILGGKHKAKPSPEGIYLTIASGAIST